mmetsp:Transcript_43374/g.135860  ORF Transcript_43374/g.135860 Transcript_43374/m.135860 type:complete len:235 (-) Transcript_43374:1311-2015(-)
MTRARTPSVARPSTWRRRCCCTARTRSAAPRGAAAPRGSRCRPRRRGSSGRTRTPWEPTRWGPTPTEPVLRCRRGSCHRQRRRGAATPVGALGASRIASGRTGCGGTATAAASTGGRSASSASRWPRDGRPSLTATSTECAPRSCARACASRASCASRRTARTSSRRCSSATRGGASAASSWTPSRLRGGNRRRSHRGAGRARRGARKATPTGAARPRVSSGGPRPRTRQQAAA